MRTGSFKTILPGLHCWRSGLKGSQQPVNSYILQDRDQATLIDPSADLKPSLLRPLGIRRVKDILITHFQSENVAGCFHFPGVHLWVPSGDEYLAEGIRAYRRLLVQWPPPWDWTTRGNYLGHLAGAPNERPLQRPVRVDSLLTDCKRVADCRVLPTPGHGKHAVTLVVEINNQRVGFCGDLVYLEGRLWNWFDCDWDYGLQTGHRELRQSALRLKQEHCDLLCPTHGDLIYNPRVSLKRLIERLDVVLADDKPISSKPINFDEKESPATGFRQILPCLHQWRDGNCAVIISETGNALMVDDGLCYWKSLSRRAAHHRSVIKDLKQSLGIRKIEIVIPTHYHGDHTENIPELVAMEGSEVVCLDTVADPIEHPERYRLAAMLPWYGTTHDRVRVSRKLSDGERLRWHEFEVNIFHLGGQTRHALGVAVNIWNVQTLFVGDAFDLRFPLCNPILCFNDADPSTVGWPYAIKRMLQWKPDLLVCGHGCAVRSPIHLLRRCQDGWRRRLRAFAQLNARKELRRFFDPFF